MAVYRRPYLEPGESRRPTRREFCRAWPNQQEVTVTGHPFVQEDSPAEIGEAIDTFIAR